MISKQELYDVIAQIYAKHPTGGPLHNVLDDGNTEDHNIAWCISHSIADYHGEDRQLFLRCVQLLMEIKSPRRRHKHIEAALSKISW